MKILSMSLELLQADSRTDNVVKLICAFLQRLISEVSDIHNNVIQCNVLLFVLNANRSNHAFCENLIGTAVM